MAIALGPASSLGDRVPPLEMLRLPSGRSRGIGRAASGADGGPPTRPGTAIDVAQRAQISRGRASALDTNPAAQGGTRDGPGGVIDVRA
ncbi:MAG: hypothetical protein FJ033_10285 [Chloroflexi bacterium]|nr:hypothetical protein [Chloroflexota bacterium]